MKGLLSISFFIPLCFFSTFIFSQNRYWVGNSTYLTNFYTTSEINDWNLIEDNGTGSWGLSGNGTAILKMDDAVGLYANRIFNVDGASPKLLPLDNINGIVEFNLISVKGGTQNYFLQVQEFNSSGTYLTEQNLLFGTNTVGYFSVDLSTITWNASTTQIRFVIGGSNYAAQQGAIEFDYFSYTNNNKNWSNSSNWSLTSGGIAGATAPGIGDTAIFDGSGNFNGICFLDVNTSVGTIRMNGYNGSIDLRGYNLTVVDEANFQTGQITNSGIHTSLTLNCTNDAIFSGTTFNIDVNGSVDGLFLNGSTFNNSLTITKTGVGLNESDGGNIFNGTTIIRCNNAAATIRLANISNDIFNSEVTFSQTLGVLEPAYNNITVFNANVICIGADSIVFGANTGSTSFLGNYPQSISATTTPTFNRLLMNKPSSSLTLNTPINIGKEATFVTGIMYSTTVNDITFVDNAIASGASTISYVDGTITKIGDDFFSFPTGNDGNYRPISISSPSSSSAKFRCKYFKSDPGILYDRSLKDLTLDSISNCEYWLLDRVFGTDSVSVSLSWSNTGTCVITALNELSIARWDGAMWKDHGDGGKTGNLGAGTITTFGVVTSFSPFTFAITNTPLPIKLLNFTATLIDNNSVKLDWQTASEINNDYFTVERSTNASAWEELSIVNGAGNSSALIKYQTIDRNPFSNNSYYRLKQTDFDGQFEYSQIRSVDIENNIASSIKIFPNPTKDQITIIANSLESEQIKIYNVLEQDVTGITEIISDKESILVIDLSSLTTGMYYIKSQTTANKVYKQ